MAGLNDEAQWIVLMGFIVSFSLFFLAIIVNQSIVVGQTTAEAVSEFPKYDIRGVRDVIIQSEVMDDDAPFHNRTNVQREIRNLSRTRQNAIVDFTSAPAGGYSYAMIHYNNGVIAYNETWKLS
ncbi:hypothetical protein [uncultured Methanoregula sp.]|uniref:hypothetical protein n=1 Tax=uncultured Methanoregula sp. TaxID=1005933 RepID=UPI002AABDF1E|nr:hypothetical protein [uncultured Methanoregula sp.]